MKPKKNFLIPLIIFSIIYVVHLAFFFKQSDLILFNLNYNDYIVWPYMPNYVLAFILLLCWSATAINWLSRNKKLFYYGSLIATLLLSTMFSIFSYVSNFDISEPYDSLIAYEVEPLSVFVALFFCGLLFLTLTFLLNRASNKKALN